MLGIIAMAYFWPMNFRKIIAGLDFFFEESRAMIEAVFIVEVENYPFLMFEDRDKWIIVGNVPPWIRELEEQLSGVITATISEQTVH
jgi:hypothetical protein